MGSNAEAEGHAKSVTGVAIVGAAGAGDNAETVGVAATRRTLPPVVRRAIHLLDGGVTSGIVGVLRTLTSLGVGDLSENLHLG